MSKKNYSKNSKTKEKKEYPPSFGFWPSRSGKGFTVVVTEQLLATLSKAQEGGTLFLQETSEDDRESNDRIPHFRVTLFPPRENEKKEAAQEESI